MKIKTECVPCLVKRVIFESEQSRSDGEKKVCALRSACKMLSEIYDPDRCSAEIATKIHKKVYEILEDADPYSTLKQQSNVVAHQLVSRVETYIKESEDSLKSSMLCSIIGNSMDYGIEGASNNAEMLKEAFDALYEKGLGYDDYSKVVAYLKKAKKIVLFTDNCGEIVFDKILCRQLKKSFPHLFITLVVKGEPVLSDATKEDAEQLHFLDVVDEIVTTGCFAVGVDFSQLPKKLENALRDCDLIICKGMANYESFSETAHHPIVYLLRTKCNAIAKSMDLPVNSNIIKLYE
jgi:damage-control phosphatase, subfamily I